MPRANSFADFVWCSWMPDLEDELVSLLGAMRSAFPIHIEPTLSSGSPVPVSTKCIFVNNPNNPGLTVVVSLVQNLTLTRAGSLHISITRTFVSAARSRLLTSHQLD